MSPLPRRLRGLVTSQMSRVVGLPSVAFMDALEGPIARERVRHVLLSIVGVNQVLDGYYAGKSGRRRWSVSTISTTAAELRRAV